MSKGFIRTIILIVIGLFILSYFGIFKVEEYIEPGQVRNLFQSFIEWIKGFWN